MTINQNVQHSSSTQHTHAQPRKNSKIVFILLSFGNFHIFYLLPPNEKKKNILKDIEMLFYGKEIGILLHWLLDAVKKRKKRKKNKKYRNVILVDIYKQIHVAHTHTTPAIYYTIHVCYTHIMI